MAKSTKKPAASLTRGMFDTARKLLEDAPDLPPEKQPVTMREGIAGMRESIEAAKAKGYSNEDIAAMLTKAGIDVTASTLASYARPVRKRAATKPASTRKAPPPASSAGPVAGAAGVKTFHHDPNKSGKDVI